jgi:hypothetical protein
MNDFLIFLFNSFFKQIIIKNSIVKGQVQFSLYDLQFAYFLFD